MFHPACCRKVVGLCAFDLARAIETFALILLAIAVSSAVVVTALVAKRVLQRHMGLASALSQLKIFPRERASARANVIMSSAPERLRYVSTKGERR